MNSPFSIYIKMMFYTLPPVLSYSTGTNTANIWSTTLSILVSAVSVVSVILSLSNNAK